MYYSEQRKLQNMRLLKWLMKRLISLSGAVLLFGVMQNTFAGNPFALSERDLLSTQKISFQIQNTQPFEITALLNGGCFKGNQTLKNSEIHLNSLKPTSLKKEILSYRKRNNEFTAMSFMTSELMISMNVLDDQFVGSYCSNQSSIPVVLKGYIVNLITKLDVSIDGNDIETETETEQIDFVQRVDVQNKK